MLQRQLALSHSRGLLIGLLVCAIVVVQSLAFAHAQTGRLAVSVDGFSSADWPQAQSILTVLDANGKPVEGLTQDNIHAQVNASAVTVTSVSRGVDSNLPSFVVLAIDASANMAGAPLDQTKLAARQFVDALGLQDSVAILSYSDNPMLVQPFTQDRIAAHAAIDSLTAGGGNGLYRAATQGVLLGASSAQTGRRALVLISSGADDTSDDPRQSLVAAKSLGVPTFIIGLGGAIDRAYLQQFADAGGGRFSEAATPDGLVPLYHDVSELLRNQYVVGIDASGLDVETTRAVTLQVEVTAGESTGSTERIVCPAQVCASFRQLQSGTRLAQSQSIVADIVSSESIQSVSLLVDGSPVQTLQDAPYEFTVDPAKFKSGEHTLAIAVIASSGSGQFDELRVQLGAKAGGSSLSAFVVPAAIVLLVLAVSLVLFALLRRRGRGGDAPRPSTPSPEPNEPVRMTIAKNRARVLRQRGESPPPSSPIEAEPALGYLKMTDGPLAGQSFPVGAKPVSIGSGHRCQIQLPGELGGYEVPSEFARVWIRADQLMVHEVRRLTAMGAVGGQWEFLSNHDTFAIGPCAFRFDLDEPDISSPEPTPSVLRDQPAAPPEPTDAEIEPGPFAIKPLPAPILHSVSQPNPDEPLPNIFRDRTEDVSGEVEEPAAEQAVS